MFDVYFKCGAQAVSQLHKTAVVSDLDWDVIPEVYRALSIRGKLYDKVVITENVKRKLTYYRVVRLSPWAHKDFRRIVRYEGAWPTYRAPVGSKVARWHVRFSNEFRKLMEFVNGA
jgi:hypothetical protein